MTFPIDPFRSSSNGGPVPQAGVNYTGPGGLRHPPPPPPVQTPGTPPLFGAPPAPAPDPDPETDVDGRTLATYDATAFPDLIQADIPIGQGTPFMTMFPGIRNGPGGHAWIFAKKACEAIPLAWSRQRTKLTSDQYVTSSWVTMMVIQVTDDTQRREHFLLRADRVGFWLANVNVDKTGDPIAQAKLRFFQDHAAEAIEAWLNGRPTAAPQAGAAAVSPEILQRLVEYQSRSDAILERLERCLDQRDEERSHDRIALVMANRAASLEWEHGQQQRARADVAERTIAEFQTAMRRVPAPSQLATQSPEAVIVAFKLIVGCWTRHGNYDQATIWRWIHHSGTERLRWVNPRGQCVRFRPECYEKARPGPKLSKIQAWAWATTSRPENARLIYDLYDLTFAGLVHGPMTGQWPDFANLAPPHDHEDDPDAPPAPLSLPSPAR